MNRRNLLLGMTGLALGISGCSDSSKEVTLDDCPALRGYIASMCNIPGGSFFMGSDDDEYQQPKHNVPISTFRMGKTPVTREMYWEYVCKSNPKLESRLKKFVLDNSDHPRVGLTWNECKTFVAWASKVSGVKLSLPNEAAWEYACRGGREGLKYPWGNDFDRSKVWCSDEKVGDRGSTGSVNRRVYIFKEHPFGLLDMIGNTWEWCEDWFDPRWYGLPEASEKDVVNLESSPTVKVESGDNTSVEKSCRCARGGSWYDDSPYVFRCAYRGRNSPDSRYNNLGFRLSAGPK